MRSIIALASALLLGLASVALAQQVVIELREGAPIRGDLREFDAQRREFVVAVNGDIVRVPEASVREVRFEEAAPVASAMPIALSTLPPRGLSAAARLEADRARPIDLRL